MERVEVAGIALDVEVRGSGSPLLYLHPEHYLHLNGPFLERLAAHWQVFSPRHPGFDGRTPAPGFRRVDDLAYLYLDLLEQLDLSGVTVVGASFGGWIGLEMGIRGCPRVNSMALIAPLGAKLGSRQERDFADLFALSDAEAAKCLFADRPPDLGEFTHDQLTEVARDRQYVAYYGWKPYLHNPGLARWLHRVKLPTHLLWGEGDGFVSPEFGKRLAGQLPHARLDIIGGAGHYPQIERLDETIVALCAGPCGPRISSDTGMPGDTGRSAE